MCSFPSLFSLENKVALVTGAGQGLGREMAKALAQAGAYVILNGRNHDHLTKTQNLIESDGGSSEILAFDITDQEEAQKAFDFIQDKHQKLDILINNAAMRDRRGLFEFLNTDIKQMLETNLEAPFELARKAAKLMIPQKQGRIVNVTSIAGPIAAKNDALYTMAKGGLDSATRALAADLGPYNITVNAIAPGCFLTPPNEHFAEEPEMQSWIEGRSALGRLGAPPEIAGAALFLTSDAASFVTGHTLVVDGGLLGYF